MSLSAQRLCISSSPRPCRSHQTAKCSALKRPSGFRPSGDQTPSIAAKIGMGLATSTFVLFNAFTAPVLAQEVASIAADSALDDAAEAARTLLPNPSGLFDKEKAAQNAEAQEKRAVDAPQSSFRAASPVGGEGEVSNLADQGLKGGSGFEAAASKLKSANSGQQYEAATEVDKKLQKADDYNRSAQFKSDAPGSKTGNSVIGRTDKQISGGQDIKPQAPSLSIFNLGGK